MVPNILEIQWLSNMWVQVPYSHGSMMNCMRQGSLGLKEGKCT